MLSNFLIIPVVAIPTGAPTTLENKMIDIPPLVVLKTIKILTI